MARLLFDCRFRYDGGFALDARFEAGDGVTALFGPSGSGKTTILALVAGLLRPRSGSIKLGERVLADEALFLPPERRRLGVVFQDHLLFPHLTVRDNLRFGLGRLASRLVNFDRVVEVLEIGALLDRKPDALSGGQRQRVALGRALLRGPEMLLMDEPLVALEEGLKDRILGFLERALAEWRIPTLLVSHDQADVRRLAGQVVVIEAGRVVAAGPTAETLNRLMAGGKTGACPVNLLRVTDLCRVEGHWQGRLGGQVVHLPPADLVAGEAVYVQFQPQAVILARGPDVAGLSVRNRLQGVVREVVGLAAGTFVAVDVGQFLWAQVTAEAARELELRPGEPVTCLVKTSALTMVG